MSDIQTTRARGQLANQAALNQLLSSISRQLFAASPEQLDDAINLALGQIGALCDVDRTYIFSYSPDNDLLDNSFEWCNLGIQPQIDNLQGLGASDTPAWMETIKNDHAVVIDDVSQLDENWLAERRLLQAQSIQSLLAVPMRNPDGLMGFMGFDVVRKKRKWLPEEQYSLRLFADLVSIALQNRISRLHLQTSEFRWKFALEGSGQGVWDWNTRTNEVYRSRRWKEILGYADGEIASTPEEWSSRVHPDDLENTLKAVHDHLTGRTPLYRNEHRLQHKNGHYLWILDRGVVVSRDENGKALRMIGTHTDVTESHEIRQRIIDSEMQLNAIFENSQVGIMLLTGYRRLARCNQRMADIAGYSSPQQMTGISMLDLHIDEEHFKDFGERYYENLRLNKMLHIEYQLRRQDGTAVWCLLSGKALDEASPPDLSKGVIWVVDDIDHLKQTERELREQRDLFSGGPALVFQWRPEEGWPISFCSPNVSDVLEYDCADLLEGRIMFASLIHPDDLTRIGQEVGEFIESGIETFEQEYRLRHADGHYLDFYDYTRLQRDPHGAISSIHGYLLDITERKKAEMALRESSQRYSDVVNSTLDGFWVVNGEGLIEEVNEAYCSGSGYTRNEIIGHHVSKFDEIDDQEEVLRRIEQIRRHGNLIFESNHRRKDGSIWPVEISVTFSNVRDGRLFAFLRNIEERKEAEREHLRLEREIQQSRKMEALGQLAGDVAHEFNNMLAIFHGHSRLLHNALRDNPDPKLAGYVQNIDQAGQKAAELTRQMLAYSRPAERKPQRIPTNSSVQQAIELIHASLPSSITVKFMADENAPDIDMDSLELQQILTNLLINARDAMGGKGKIDVATRHILNGSGNCQACHAIITGEWVEISVSDCGHGITREHLSRLFEPFFTTKEVGKGTGLGLSLVQALIERNGGHILLESKPGQGTRFRLLLPPASGMAEVTDYADQTVHFAESRSGRILVVDDEPLLTLYLSEMLAPSGHEVTTTNSSVEALKILQSRSCRFDILITDQTMPGMLGTELVEEARRSCNNLKTILCTGHSDIVSEFNAHDFAIDCFLTKPVDPDQLDHSIQTLLENLTETE